jgi:hypothetical protein
LNNSAYQYQNIIATNGFQIGAALSYPSLSWAHQGFSQSPNHITANGYHFNQLIAFSPLTFDDCDYHVTHPTPDAFGHPPIPGQNDATATRSQLVSIDSYALNKPDLQHQNANDANDRQSNAVINLPSLRSAYQPVAQNASQIAADRDYFNRSGISSLTFDNFAFARSDSIADGQFDTTLQLPDLSSNIDVGLSNGFDGFNGFGGPNSFNNSTAFFATASELNGFANTNTQKAVIDFAKVPIPFSSSTLAPSATNAQTNRFECDHSGCTATFSRAGDLVRHNKKHGIPEYPCLVNNCDRKGDKAFYRPDKLRDHQRMKHKMAV